MLRHFSALPLAHDCQAPELERLRYRRRLLQDKHFIVGPVLGQDGSTPATGRQAKTGDAVVTQGHGKYYESAGRGQIFAAADQGAGVTVQTSITTTGILSLHNPAASKVRLSILKVAICYFSGTEIGGAFYHGFNKVGTTLPSAGTSLTANCTDITNLSVGAAQGVALAGATVVAATVLWPFCSSGKSLATTVLGLVPSVEDIDGAIVLEPGAVYQLVAVASDVGASPKISPGIVWEEIPFAGAGG